MYYISIYLQGFSDIAQLVLQEQHPVIPRNTYCSAYIAVSELDVAPVYIQLRTRVAQLLNQIPRVDCDATTSFVLAHWFDMTLASRNTALSSQWRGNLRKLITRELRMAQRIVNEERLTDEEMQIALRRRGAGSTAGCGWLVPSNSADARAMLEDIRTNVL